MMSGAEERKACRSLADDVCQEASVRLATKKVNRGRFLPRFVRIRPGRIGQDARRRFVDKVIEALKDNGGFVTLTSTNMKVDAVAIMKSAHIDARHPLQHLHRRTARAGASRTSAIWRGNPCIYPSLTLSRERPSIAAPDRILIGDDQESDIHTYLDWVDDDDALGVVGCDRDTVGQGFLTIQSGA